MQLFMIAVLLGFTSSMPVGPINLFVADSVLNGDRVRKFILGVVIADVAILLAVTLAGLQHTFEGLWGVILWLLSSLVVFVLAISMLLTLRGEAKGRPRGWRRISRDKLWLGFALCAANPGFWMFWFSASHLLTNSLELQLSVVACAVMVAGVALGDFTWFFLLVRTLRHSLRKLGEKVLLTLRVLAAALLLIFAAISLVQSFAKLLHIL